MYNKLTRTLIYKPRNKKINVHGPNLGKKRTEEEQEQEQEQEQEHKKQKRLHLSFTI